MSVDNQMKIKDISDLEVFKLAHDVTLEIYKITNNFPKEEIYGLTSQMRRASSLICGNLMEGIFRNSSKEFKQFCGIARGSIAELRYFIILARDLGYISNQIADELINKTIDISRMLYGLIKSIENKVQK